MLVSASEKKREALMIFGLEKKFCARTWGILQDLAGLLILRGAGIFCRKYTHTEVICFTFIEKPRQQELTYFALFGKKK